MNRIRNIEFLRIFFTLIIVYGHLMQWYIFPNFMEVDTIKTIYKNFTFNFGYIVEMFFVISGFLLFKSTRQKTDVSWLDFVKKKIIRLWPVLAFSFIAIAILAAFKLIHFEKYPNFFALFLLDGSGLTGKMSNNGYAWYVPSMFWVLIFYYYLIKNFSSKVVNIVLGIIVYLTYAMILPNNLFYPQDNFLFGFLQIGILRALASIGIGYFIGLAYFNANITPGKAESKRSFILILIDGNL